jgi:tetratricopeptide (TPR) repeat protein
MPLSEEARAFSLLDQGRAYLDKGDRAQAESCFRTAASISRVPAALNNWALCRHLDGAHADALSILSPVLGGPDPAPFTRALASLAHSALGDRKAATTYVNAAIRDLDDRIRETQWRQTELDAASVDYTTLIKQAAGQAGLHRLVLDLHARWPGRDLPAGAFYAGVAAFNLNRFAQAAKYWQGIRARNWAKLMGAFTRVADLAEQGLVPPFALEYQTSEPEEETDPVALAALGTVRVRMLACLFEPQAADKSTMANSLIATTGEWGLELGRRLLAGATVPMEVKTGAAKALTDAGIFAMGQPIPIVHQGKPTAIIIHPIEFDGESSEGEAVLKHVRRLRELGKKEEAVKVLSDLYARGIAYPPAMMTQANLLRELGDLDHARTLLEGLEKLAPDDPAVLFNLAGLWLQYGDLARAGDYALRIDASDTTPEFKRLLAGLMNEIVRLESLAHLPGVADIANAYRNEVEEKPISPNIRLAAALKQIPVQWLNATASLYGLPPAKRRPERERALAGVLQEPGRLQTALASEESSVRDALRYVLEEGGWCKLQALTRRFGPPDEDGFFWDEKPPVTPIGRLRLLGLLYVGRTLIGGKRHKIAVIPADLRPLL